MINNVTLVGRLTAAPDLRKTPSNVSALQCTLAVNRNFKNQNGEREADFINFQAWRGTADIITEYCGKGSLIGITGRIQVRSYEKDGQRRYVTEVVSRTEETTTRAETAHKVATGTLEALHSQSLLATHQVVIGLHLGTQTLTTSQMMICLSRRC